MGVGNVNSPKSNWENANFSDVFNIADLTNVVLELKKKKLKVKKAKIKDIAKGLSEIAYSMGETNDKEGFAEEMADDIFEGLKLAEQRRLNRKKKKS